MILQINGFELQCRALICTFGILDDHTRLLIFGSYEIEPCKNIIKPTHGHLVLFRKISEKCYCISL